MKKERFFKKKLRRALLFAAINVAALPLFAQGVGVSGTVVDETGATMPGVNIVVVGTTNGVVSDLDGKYSITVPDGNAILRFSFVGYETKDIAVGTQTVIDVQMSEGQQLEEVVVVGYGSAKKSDLTGSITSIGQRDFQKGMTTTPGSLISGRVAGVQITSNGGRAGDGNRIRIRGGASLNASNDPLIVVDGVPLDNSAIAGQSNPLASINPNDIESMNILKDASATAIYGSRASNGVIIITTKKGLHTGGIWVEGVSSQNAISTVARRIDVMSADEFREAVTREAAKNPNTEQMYLSYLGQAKTDWQKEIFRNAFTSDNNISISGGPAQMPFRLSVGFMSQEGTLKTDKMQRTTASLNMSPSLFDEHLKINLNLKGTFNHSRFGNGDAIGAALRMDPTKPVTADGFDKFNGYWQWLDNTGNLNTLATKNPESLLNGRADRSNVLRSIGNIQLDYKMHFLPELRANLNLGYDVSQGKGNVYVQPWSPSLFAQGGEHSKYQQDKQNVLMEFYLNYTKNFNADHRLELMAGYTYQDWKTTDHSFEVTDYAGNTVVTEASVFPTSTQQNTLISFYGRLNYTLKEKYLLTATIREDGSSRFGKQNRWGLFPSAALAWRISEEDFLKGNNVLSNLKLRLGYGVTGQQDGIGNYDHIARYDYSDPTAQVQFGDKYYHLWRPAGYDPQRKWEQTATTNVGLDFGVMKNRLSGSIDVYYKYTSDLLNEIPVPMGSNFTNLIVKNIGNLENRGVEANFSAVLLDNDEMHWDAGFNITYNKTKITKLSLNDGPSSDYVGAPKGGITGGTSNTIQIHSVGYAPYAFYAYRQIYDPDGRPIEGAYADLNNDGRHSPADLYHYKKPEPDVFMGFNTSFTWRQWTLSTALRASIGNYAYNNVNSDMGNYSQVLNPNNYLQNTVRAINNSGFFNRELLSDFYIENASFLKMDYVQLMYDFYKVFDFANLRASATVQNVFTATKYSGIDPEIAGGIDNNFYPNPRIFMIGLSLTF